ncbi:secretory phospholipase A2 receptor-like [Eucyclogobius newberryi]|uniref:secretory phospholipase A2 receptor-like n=1 Tax=Eucyclogobius newberryi TaxID=166745 RepID=UPI003B5CDB15
MKERLSGRQGQSQENLMIVMELKTVWQVQTTNESSNTFVMIEEERTWLEAQQFCREHHTDLMSGLDQQRQFQVKYPTRSEKYWIGLSRDTWAWSDKSDSSFRNWNSDVNPLNHKCAALRAQGRWESDDCDLKKPFICHDKILILVKQKKTWEEALVHCRENHRDLVWFIDNEHLKEMVRVRAEMADSEFVWVGLHYACFMEAWFWVNGHYVSNTNENWKDQENNECGMTGAVEKGGGKWVKQHFENKYNFISMGFSHQTPDWKHKGENAVIE